MRTKKTIVSFLIMILLVMCAIPAIASQGEPPKKVHIEMTDDLTLEELASYLGDKNLVKNAEVTKIPQKKSSKLDKNEERKEKAEVIVVKYGANQELNSSGKQNEQVANVAGTAVFQTEIGTNPSTSGVKARVKLVAISGDRPNWFNVDLYLKNATSRYGSYSNFGFTMKTLGDMNPGAVTDWYEKTVKETNFWKATASVKAVINGYPNGGSFTAKEGDAVLLNRKAERYPNYTDPNSGLVMTEPSTTTWSKTSVTNSCRLTITEKNNYKDWYDKKYGAIKWNNSDGTWNYEVHHIRPCFLGGGKSYDNLIPLPRSFHRGTVNGWFQSYLGTNYDEAGDE